MADFQIFIDGGAGTTGLQVASRLAERPDLDLLILEEDQRKDEGARRAALAKADLAILCLPDDGAIQAAQWVAEDGLNTRLIDASSAHRVATGWTYGFAEMRAGQKQAIEQAQFVSNPGCYPTGFLSLACPLRASGLLLADAMLHVPAVSGYSGGGKGLINAFEAGEEPPFFVYGLGLGHKHLPEMQHYAELSATPFFMPTVGDFAQGMLVSLPLHAAQFTQNLQASDLYDIFAEAFADQPLVSVHPVQPLADHSFLTSKGFLAANRLAGTDRLEIAIFTNALNSQFWLVAMLDNLGKGASGAAVQNLNLMLGAEMTAGLNL